MNEITLHAIATKFVDLILKYQDSWQVITELPENEMSVFFLIVRTVGFEITEVKEGKLVGHYHDQDGITGKTYPINKLCPFKVVNKDRDNYNATNWLDSMFSTVISSHNGKPYGEYDLLVERVIEAVRKSIHLTPVLLTSEGDTLREYPSDNLFKHTNDSDKLGSSVGVHKVCNGFMDRKSTTETHDVILCRSCGLRVSFPNTIKTYGELRQFFNSKLNN